MVEPDILMNTQGFCHKDFPNKNTAKSSYLFNMTYIDLTLHFKNNENINQGLQAIIENYPKKVH